MSWRENVRTVEPYVPGEQPNKPGMVKLNTNECPYPPAPGVAKMAKDFECGNLRLYPDPKTAGLTKALADYYQVSSEQVFVGVGSDDVIAMAFLTFFNSEKPILFPDITYSFYDVWAELYKIPYRTCPVDENFKINVNDYKVPNGGIIIANPNAPTGVFEPLETIEEILKANPESIVIIDEAYVDFGGESCISLVEKYENLLVVQTFSKSRSMAGCRIGFAVGNKEMIGYLNDVKFSYNSYTMNMPSQVLGVEAVKDKEYFETTVNKVIKTRERVKGQLTDLGFHFTDSMTNFIFASHKEVAAKEIYEALYKQDIFVRYFAKPRIDNYLRISIGTDEEMDKLIVALKEIVK